MIKKYKVVDIMKKKYSIIHNAQYYETDQMGVIHHANYVKWMEESRNEFFKSLGINFNKIEEQEVYMAVLYQNVKYLKSVKYNEKVEITCHCIKISSTKIDFVYDFYNIDKSCICAQGNTSHCFVNKTLEPVVFKKMFPNEYNLLTNSVTDED